MNPTNTSGIHSLSGIQFEAKSKVSAAPTSPLDDKTANLALGILGELSLAQDHDISFLSEKSVSQLQTSPEVPVDPLFGMEDPLGIDFGEVSIAQESLVSSQDSPSADQATLTGNLESISTNGVIAWKEVSFGEIRDEKIKNSVLEHENAKRILALATKIGLKAELETILNMKQVRSVIGGGPVSFVVNYQDGLVVLPDYLKKHDEFDRFLVQHGLQQFHIIFAEQEEVVAFTKELEEFAPWLEGFLEEQLAKHQEERQEEAKRKDESTAVFSNTGKQRHISPQAHSNTEEIDYQRVALKDSLRFSSIIALKLRDKTKSRYKEELDAYEIKRAKMEEERTLLETTKRIEKSRIHQDLINYEVANSETRRKAQLKRRQA